MVPRNHVENKGRKGQIFAFKKRVLPLGLEQEQEDIKQLPRLSPCLDEKPKFQKKIPAPAWRLKFRRNKKHISTAVCKWRDESNEPNRAVIRC